MKIKRKGKTKSKKIPILIGLLVILILLVTVPLFLAILGFDQGIVPTTLEGRIKSTTGDNLSEATVRLQDQETVTDEYGYYKLEELVYGVYEVEISKNGYETYKEEVRLQRFSNSQDFELKPLEFGEVLFKLDTGDDPFTTSEFSFRINDEEYEVGEKFEIESGRLLVGNYVVKVSSPFYKDFENTIEIIPGKAEQTVKLVPAADIIAEVNDWLSGEQLNPDEVQIKTGDAFEQLKEEYVNGNQIELLDQDISNDFEIKVIKENFNTFQRKFKIEQGRNSLGELKLVKEGKLLSVIDDGFNRGVFVSNYNGTKLDNLFNTSLNCSEVVQTVNKGYVKCANGSFFVIELDEESEVISNPTASGEYVYFDIWSNDVLVVDNSKEDKLIRFRDETFEVVYNGEEDVTGVIVGRNRNAIFTTTNAVWKFNDGDASPEQLSEGQFELADINPSGTRVLMLNKLAGGQNNIWMLKTANKVKKKLTFLPASHSDVKFINDKDFLFLSNKSGSQNLYSQNSDSTISRQLRSEIDSLSYIIDSDIVKVTKGDKVLLLSLNSNNLTRVRI